MVSNIDKLDNITDGGPCTALVVKGLNPKKFYHSVSVKSEYEL